MGRVPVPRGAVAAGHPETAAAAAEVLRDGGNAFDAAIAALWTACIAEPVLASPCGGGFVAARARGGPPEVFDFFADTPLAAPSGARAALRPVDADFGITTQEFHIGAGAVATPGFVPGLFALHAAHGSVAMADLVAPAARLARDGLAITPFQAGLMAIVRPILEAEPASRALFAPGGSLLEAGAAFRNPELAETLEAFGRDGAELVRDGAIARDIVAAVENGGGALTARDLAEYGVVRRVPLSRQVGDATVWTNPPPAAGGVLMLLILAQHGASDDAVGLARAIDRVDRLRRDRDFCPGGGIADLAAGLDCVGRRVSARGTTHVSVIDGDGNAVAATVSNGEGNGQMVGGFMLNNMLGEDDLNPGGPGVWEPGTRLASMMAPTLIDVEGATVALGSGGSNRIRSALARVVSALVAGTPLGEAVEAPRLHVEAGHLDFEDDFDGPTRARLTNLFADHRAWSERSLFFGGVHAVARGADGEFAAVGDRRRAGAALVSAG